MAFGVRFFEVVTSQTKCRVRQKSQERQVPKSGQIVAKMWAFISPCAFSAAVLQMQALKAWQSPTFLHTNGEAAVAPPLGEFNGIIDVRKMMFFNIDFFGIFASILEPLGLPRKSQVGLKTIKNTKGDFFFVWPS